MRDNVKMAKIRAPRNQDLRETDWTRIIFVCLVITILLLGAVNVIQWQGKHIIDKNQAEALSKGYALGYCLKRYSDNECKTLRVDSDFEKEWYGPTDGPDEYVGDWLVYSRTKHKTILVSLGSEGELLHVSEQ